MALDLKAWLGEMGVSADKIDAVLPVLSEPTIATNIEKSGLRLSDYSRQMTELKGNQTKLDEANERLNQEMLEWAETRNQGGQVTDQMRNDLARYQGEVVRLKTIVSSKATELGLDPKAILGDDIPAAPPVQPPANAGVDMSGYVKQDQLGAYGRFQLLLAAQMPRIQHEHQQLTGEWLDPADIIGEFEQRAGDRLNRNADGTFKKPIDLMRIWEEKFSIPEKRTAKAAADQKLRDDQIREEGRQEVRSQAALPGQQPRGQHAPIFKAAGDPASHVSKLQRPSAAAQSDKISKAASALATHRYRGTGNGRPAA
jgi:hypothetical protein